MMMMMMMMMMMVMMMMMITVNRLHFRSVAFIAIIAGTIFDTVDASNGN